MKPHAATLTNPPRVPAQPYLSLDSWQPYLARLCNVKQQSSLLRETKGDRDLLCSLFQKQGPLYLVRCPDDSLILCVAVCCSVLQCVALCCSAISRWFTDAVCCSALQCVAVCCSMLQCVGVRYLDDSLILCVAVCCSELHCTAARYLDASPMLCVVACCSMLQCVAVRYLDDSLMLSGVCDIQMIHWYSRANCQYLWHTHQMYRGEKDTEVGNKKRCKWGEQQRAQKGQKRNKE